MDSKRKSLESNLRINPIPSRLTVFSVVLRCVNYAKSSMRISLQRVNGFFLILFRLEYLFRSTTFPPQSLVHCVILCTTLFSFFFASRLRARFAIDTLDFALNRNRGVFFAQHSSFLSIHTLTLLLLLMWSTS